MPTARVRIAVPPGSRSCGGGGPSLWAWARDSAGSAPFINDTNTLRGRFPSKESEATYMEMVRERMKLAAAGALPWDLSVQMQSAPDVLEIKMPDWTFSGGPMHVRLYYSEPWDLPGALVALRLKTKRPGPIGLTEQDRAAQEASDLLQAFSTRGFV